MRRVGMGFVAAAVALMACRSEPGEPARRVASAPATHASSRTPPDGLRAGRVLLDGALLDVRWADGDTFSWRGPRDRQRQRARLARVNTLESYGPVHQWGRWQPGELDGLAQRAGRFARSRGWVCSDTGRSGGYGRKLVHCPELAQELVKRGYAHVFELREAAETDADNLLALQRRAQRAGLGIWAKGVPDGIVTSVHSRDERQADGQTYNRVADTATGHAARVPHENRYAECQWVCLRGSCMAYIPFRRRHRADPPSCGKPPSE